MTTNNATLTAENARLKAELSEACKLLEYLEQAETCQRAGETRFIPHSAGDTARAILAKHKGA